MLCINKIQSDEGNENHVMNVMNVSERNNSLEQQTICILLYLYTSLE